MDGTYGQNATPVCVCVFVYAYIVIIIFAKNKYLFNERGQIIEAIWETL